MLQKRRTIFKIGLPPFDGLGKVVLVDVCQASRLVVCQGKCGEAGSEYSGGGARRVEYGRMAVVRVETVVGRAPSKGATRVHSCVARRRWRGKWEVVVEYAE